MSASPALAHPGFADPVASSQACFRAVLDAMARPGTIHAVAAPIDPPSPLDRATAAMLLTLVDADTPVWLDGAAEAAMPWIAFHCGAARTGMADATFGLALGPLPLLTFAAGSDDAPEDGATLILQVAALGEGRRLRLSGPGLLHAAPFAAAGLPDGFVADWAANRARFPRGIDVLLCAGDHLAALPRTVTIEDA